MSFGLSGAALAGIAVGGATLVSGMAQADAASSAAAAQTQASEAGIAEQRRQFDVVQKLLEPYVTGGTKAFEQQQALVGVQGPEAQRAAIAALEQGPAFQALQQQGENALLQQASATGGLRGGNVQAALAQFRPQLLSQLIEQQYGQLGGLAKYGQASAAGTGAAAQETGSNLAQLLAAQGAAQAGGQLAAGKAFASIPSAISGGLGIFSGLGGKF
jgi:hypothetical protein